MDVRGEPDAPSRTPGLEERCAVCGAALGSLHLEREGGLYRCTFCGAGHAPPGSARPAPSPPGAIGEELRRARAAVGISLELAAKDTCIQERFLRGLEDDEPLDVFPGDVYARFFLREYASYLGLDPAPLVAAFDEGRETPPFTLEPGPSPLPDRRGPGWRLSAIVAALALLAIAIASWRGNANPGPVAPTPIGTSSSASSPAAHPTPSAPVTTGRPPLVRPPYSGVVAVVSLNAPCWITATVDGKAVTPGTLPAGRSITFRARQGLQLTLGNGGGANLTVNGRPIGTGGQAQVVRLSFEWKGGRAVRTG